ncbi:MAG: efflux RND transporter periplasmic adaptor subunit [Ignavibacteriaceae bacterium]|nr:efflux RND transporter periplasmic adaptor subunit [Ignavibacteriaceae bacterium]
MKRIKIIVLLVVIISIVVGMLMHNKSLMAAKSTNEKIEAYPVTVTFAENRKVTNNLELVGTITANNDVAIVSEAQGRVVKVLAQVGDYKPAGSVLFQLDDELKLEAYKTAEVNYLKAKKDYDRYDALYKGKSVTDAQYEQAKLACQVSESQYVQAKREYNDTKITTPISGVITARIVDLGNYVNKASVVANVVDISKLKVKLNVAEKDAFKLKTGDNVEVNTDVYPGVVFNGKISSISSKADEAHTYPVEILLANSKDHPLKSGMFGRVSFTSIKNSELLVMPREALVGSIKDAKVFVVENGIAKMKDVLIGNVYENWLEVKGGLSVGDKIVVNGQNNLQDNDKVVEKK